MAQNLEEGDVVLCTVDRIVGTIVFVKMHTNSGEKEGSIMFSEVAPGRIRNIRDYVVPKKKIVCKVLRIKGDQVHLSLRRVTQKEQKEIFEQDKQEKSYKSILKSVLKEKTEGIIKEIEKKENLYEFLESSKENPKELEKITGKKQAEEILKILKSQKSKKAVIKKEINLTTSEPDGIALIKNTLGKISDAEVKSISAGRYSIKTQAEDLKSADSRMKKILEEIEKTAKKQNMNFSVKEK